MKNTALELEHLTPFMREIALLPKEERINRILADRWLGYTKAEEAVNKLEALIAHPKRQRMPNLLICGPTNNGKSMIVEKFRRTHLLENKDHYPAGDRPILVVQMPSDPKISRFYSILLHGLEINLRNRPRVSDLEIMTLQVMNRVNVRILIIDETHNILAGTTALQREFLNLLRFLGNQLKIPIVCVGTREAYFAIRSDDQLENRFEPFTLPLWKDDHELASLLASLTSTLPLQKPSLLMDPEVIRFLLDKSEGTIGEIITLLNKAAILAIESGEERISKENLARIDYLSPTERRRASERDLIQ